MGFLRWLVVVLLLPVFSVLGQGGYPEPIETYVNDYAGILTEETEGYLRNLLADLDSRQQIQMTVVTIKARADYATGDGSLESFATNLFKMWGVGSREKNNGVMLLVAVNDRQMRIEVGTGYENALNAPMQGVIDTILRPAFRENDYNGGIYNAVRAVIEQLTGEAAADPRPAGGAGRGFSINTVIVVGATLVFLFWRRIRGRVRSGSLMAGEGSRRVGGQSSRGYTETMTTAHIYTDYSSSASSSDSGSYDSGSSSSDFGGGDSSGGGASGDW